MSLVAPEEVKSSLEKYCVPPISEFDAALGACWGIPRNINLRKSKNGKWFAVIDLIDSNSKLTKLRYWGVDKDKIHQQILLNLKMPNLRQWLHHQLQQKWPPLQSNQV